MFLRCPRAWLRFGRARVGFPSAARIKGASCAARRSYNGVGRRASRTADSHSRPIRLSLPPSLYVVFLSYRVRTPRVVLSCHRSSALVFQSQPPPRTETVSATTERFSKWIPRWLPVLSKLWFGKPSFTLKHLILILVKKKT